MTLKVDTFVVTSDVIVITPQLHHHPHPRNEGMMVQCVLSCLLVFQLYTLLLGLIELSLSCFKFN